jgi:pyruvate dehydrogenase E2 component (dihydrolipoamide acetyltransferase)
VPEIAMPRLSDSMEEGTLISWLVADGAEVEAGQALAEIETDKATMTYESEHAGTLRTAVAEGETVAVGAPIAHVLGDGEEMAAMVGSAVAGGAGTSAATGAPPATPEPPVGTAATAPSRVKASPLARRIAATLGVDLSVLAGSGPQGRVVKRDVEAAAEGGEAWPSRSPAAPASAQHPASNKGEVRVEELTRVQSTIARRMAEAKSTMPEFTLTTEIAMDAAVTLRSQLQELGGETPVPSYNDLVVRACAQALREHPRANGAYRDGRFELYESVNVGVAVAAGDALLVPVVAHADRLPLGEIAVRTRQLAERARDGQLTAAELSGGTFSVSNLGMFGVGSFTAVLNPPQAAILAVGALEQRPVVREGELAVGWRMNVTLTCDHRILYGADAARFLADIRARLEQPLRLTL